jgi:hypothetical protein
MNLSPVDPGRVMKRRLLLGSSLSSSGLAVLLASCAAVRASPVSDQSLQPKIDLAFPTFNDARRPGEGRAQFSGAPRPGRRARGHQRGR